MHIAILNPQGNFDPKDSYWTEHPDFGGQLVYVKEIALAMASLGHRVDILTRQVIDDEWPEFAAPLDRYPQSDTVRIIRIPCGPPEFLAKEELWPYLGTDWLNGILDFYESEGSFPDICTAHYADGGVVGALICKARDIPFTFSGHSLGAWKMEKLKATLSNLESLDQQFNFRTRILAERIAMNHASCVVTSTEQEKKVQYAHAAYQRAVDVLDEDHFAVVPPGVNLGLFSPEKSELDEVIADRINSAMHRDLSADRQNLPLILCSSRLDHKKNHFGLVEAFVKSDKLRKKANLAIVVRGAENAIDERDAFSGEEREILDKIASLLEVHSATEEVSAFPLNSQSELAAAYRVCAKRRSVFALTALYEPFGLAPLEAMSCGLPAVVTKNGGPSESLIDLATGEEFGVLIDPEDHEDIARGLLKTLSSESDWARYRDAGIKRVISRYTWDATATGYLKVLERIIEKADDSDLLPIPAYFEDPTPANQIPLEELAQLYFE